MWKNKLRVVSALCALIMSVSAVGPANAYSEDEVRNLESRIAGALNFVRGAISNAGNGVRSANESKLVAAQNKLRAERNVLLAATTESTKDVFDELHAVVNEAYGKVIREKNKLNFTETVINPVGLTSTYITGDLATSFNPATHRYFNNYPGLKRKMHFLESRVFELDGRLCNIVSELISMRDSGQVFDFTANPLIDRASDISTTFRRDLGSIVYSSIDVDSTTGAEAGKAERASKAYDSAMSLIDKTHREIDSLASKVGKLGKATSIMKEGTYKLRSKLNEFQCLDIAGGSCNDGGNLHLLHSMDEAAQKFRLVYDINNDGFRIYPGCVYGKSLDVQGAGQYPGVNVQQWMNFDNAPSQLWNITPTGDYGYFNIISKCNGLCLDVENGCSLDNTNVRCWTANGTDAQKFKFERL